MPNFFGQIPGEYMKDVLVQIGIVLVAFLGLIGTIVASFLSYRSSQKQKLSAAEIDAERRAAEQEAIARKAQADMALQKQEATFTEFRNELRSLSETLGSIKREVSISNQRLDKFNRKTNAKIADVEESLGKVTQILARNARQNTEMLHMHRLTDARFHAMMAMEMSNFTFTKQVSTAVHGVGTTIQTLHGMDQESLVKNMDHLSQSQDEFIRDFMKAQMEMTRPSSDFISDGEDSQLREIMNHRCHNDPDEDNAILHSEAEDT